ncbi:MAG: hypothetical protein V1758_09125 [Pseudomonadota bacterium]
MSVVQESAETTKLLFRDRRGLHKITIHWGLGLIRTPYMLHGNHSLDFRGWHVAEQILRVSLFGQH